MSLISRVVDTTLNRIPINNHTTDLTCSLTQMKSSWQEVLFINTNMRICFLNVFNQNSNLRALKAKRLI